VARTFAKLTWFAPRRCWKKKIKGKVYYFAGNGTKTQDGYAAALVEYQQLCQQQAAYNREQAGEYGQSAEDIKQNAYRLTTASHGERVAAVVAGIPPQPLGEVVAAYLADMLARLQAGEIVAQTYEQRRVILEQCRQRLEACGVRYIADITAQTLADYRQAILGDKRHKISTKRDYLRFVKWFINWAWENGKLQDLPRNINSFSKIKLRKTTEVQHYTIAEVKEMLAAISGRNADRLRLYMLLCLNCGMGYQDISDLTPSQLQEGRIIRERSKTAVPGNWLLWADTAKLLAKYGKANGELLLTTRDGKPLISHRLVGDTVKSSSAVESSLKRLWAKHGWRGSPYWLRKSGANWVEAISDKDTAKLYLAHADTSVADQHYLTRKHDKLDTALEAIEKELLS
jgi:integrase